MQRYAGRPFVLLGVSADESRDELQHTQQQAGLTWASWWDGPSGPIAAGFGVDRFPTLVLIDARGVVRLKHVGKPSAGMLEKKIDELLTEAGG